ncbi:MAG: glycosyltransferase family 4 protein [Proteobacteria bacterium]|nr:glycosyltransferase family 4 protein [Pseudomonadota bacterium]
MADERPFVLDVSRLIWRLWTGRLPTGIDRVCLAYVEHYAARSLAMVQYGKLRVVLGPGASDRLFALLQHGTDDFKARVVAVLAGAVPGGLVRNVAGRIYLNIGHTGLDTPGFPEWLARKGLRPVFLIHDLIPITHPEYCRAGEGQRHARRMRNALHCAAGVIANSQDTMDELARFAAASGERAPHGLVAWLGTNPPSQPGPLPLPRRPYFVTVGTIEARKNHLLLLHLWERLGQQLGDDTPLLILIGQRGWEADDVFSMLDRSPILRDHVIELGRCSDADLIAYLDGARALLMPSFVEGFGIPVIEALERGVPAIISDLAVFREIAGDIPLYLDPLDGPAWDEAIRAFQHDCPERQRQIAAMPGFAPPAWPAHFAKVDVWIERLPAGR